MPSGMPASGPASPWRAPRRRVGGGAGVAGRLDDKAFKGRAASTAAMCASASSAALNVRARRPSRMAARVSSVRSATIRSPWARRRSPPRLAGAFTSTLAATPPSVASSARQRKVLGMTAAIGSTPTVSTSPSCSIQPRMPFSSATSGSASPGARRMRASLAMRVTVARSTDMMLLRSSRGTREGG